MPSNSDSSFVEAANNLRSKTDQYLIRLIPKEPSSLYDPIRDAMGLGGKRVRPILTALAASLTMPGDSWLPVAAAVELLHAFTLAHDDIMDNAATRRGQPTMHIRYGTNAAILSGDVLIALAQESLAKWQPAKVLSVARDKESFYRLHQGMAVEFSKAFRQVCEGQALDKDYETRDDISMEEYLPMIDLKTSKIFELAAVLGGLAGGGQYVEELRAFAHHLGLAFQMGDDLLDLTASHATFGKTVGGDILEGKRTLLFVIAMTDYPSLLPNEQALLDRIRERRAMLEDVLIARDLFQRIGVLSRASELAKLETSKAKMALDSIPAGIGRDKLYAFSDYLLGRDV